jgi:hypothetical protein
MPVVALQRGESSGWSRGTCVALDPPQAARRETETWLPPKQSATRSFLMMDILMLALGFGFFALAIGYTYACERL